ncbi:MAG: diacylglycerol kinase family lipid kinase [Clostridia bacterium]|nr:diacylglycerol kinase family lipid kinase [Clostridia bacterium]
MAYIHTLDDVCRVLLIMNPASGMFQSKAGMYDIVSIFSKSGCVPTTLMTAKAGDATEFVRRYAETHDIVVCCGGDGTLNEVITGMMQCKRRIPIGLIPLGTTNDVARTLHIPIGNVKKAVKALVASDNVHHDVGMFGKERFFTYIASFGAFTKVSYQTPRWKKNMFGHVAYLMDSIPALGDIRPWDMDISCDVLEERGSYAFGCVSNATSIAGIVKLDPERVSFNDGKFEVMLIRHPRTLNDVERILDALVKQKFNESINGGPPYVRFFRTDKITVTPHESMPWTVDGEYGGAPEKVEIKNKHGAVEILRKV